MIEVLFKYPRVLARHRDGAFVDARDRFLTHCANQGMARGTLLRVARELLVIADRIDLGAKPQVALGEITAAADDWAHDQRRRRRIRELRGSRELFVQTAKDWLRFLKLFQEPEDKPHRDASLVENFSAFMRDERGLSEVTIRSRCWHVDKFLVWLNEQSRSFRDVALEDVDAFLAGNGKRGWGRVSVATSAKALRSFFRHAGIRGWCAASLAGGIEGPKIFRNEGLPAGPAWEDVQRLISSASSDKPRDIRDRAILMLLAVYAFRSGEVAGLRLEDVNWEKEIISITRPKQRRVQQYPLVREVGEAILRYLQQVRPRCGRREIFLTLNAPFQPLSTGGLYHVVSTRLSTLGIASLRRGPHSLRHTAATHLLRAGVDINTIRAWLGHVSLNTTNVYAEIDLEMKANALAKCKITEEGKTNERREDPALMAFLRAL